MMLLQVTAQFRKDYKRAKKRGYPMEKLKAILDVLLSEQPLDDKYRDHALGGSMNQYRECHIQPDWLLVYRKEQDRLVLIAHRTGTHSDLFDE